MTVAIDGTLIRRAQAAEAERLGGLIADEFQHLPVAAELSPEPGPRRAAMSGQFAMLTAHGIAYGDVDVIDDAGEPVAVAVWLPPDEIPDIEDYDERLAAICGPLLGRFQELDGLMHDSHPAGPPHAYLAFLAVRQAYQNRGLGSRLLVAHHAALDEAGTPAYLEASSPRSRALYARHGFADYAPPYGLDGGEHFWPMWRDAR
ncbi:MAG TPA: GNAT family N-acetyltransferase [Micromonosporaceae bacterium]